MICALVRRAVLEAARLLEQTRADFRAAKKRIEKEKNRYV